MNRRLLSIILLVFILLVSCEKDDGFQGGSTSFGTAEYYKPFLFSKSGIMILKKSLKYNFNDYATQRKSYVMIKLVDPNQNIIKDDNIKFYIDDRLIANNEFEINSEDSESGIIKIGIQFLPDYPEGYTSGFLSISKHSLDIINNNDLNTSSEVRIFKWEAKHKVVMNPLKKALIWTGTIILAFLLLWFLLLRNMLYPKFKKGRLQILKPYFGGISFNGNTKLIVFTNTLKKQQVLNKIFTGKIVYEVNSMYKQDISFRPGRNNKIKIKLPIGARINPQVINLEKFNSYSIKLGGEVIEIQYS